MATTPARPPTPFALSSSSLPGSPSLEGSCGLAAKVPWEEVREKLGAGTWAAGKELSAVESNLQTKDKWELERGSWREGRRGRGKGEGERNTNEQKRF